MSVGISQNGETIIRFDEFDDEFVLKLSREQFEFLKSSGGGMEYTPNAKKEHIIRIQFGTTK